MNKNRKHFIDAFATHLDIQLTPGGIWKLEQGKKAPVSEYSTHRKNHLEWTNYEDDNMAKHYLKQEQGLLVLDVDGEYMVNGTSKEYKDAVGSSGTEHDFYIPALELRVPNTFYTVSTRKDKYHFYFKSPDNENLPSRVTKILDTEVDTFTYGNMFEWHSFAPTHAVNATEPAIVPEHLVDILDSLDLPKGGPTQVTPTSHIQRYNLVQYFLKDQLESSKQWFAFFSTIFPKEYKPEGKRKLTIKNYELSYDLFNKIAVKLTSTAELDHYKDTIPALYKLLELWEMDPMSRTSQTLLHKNILPSLPEHEAIGNFSMEEDVLTFQEHLDQQQGTSTPVFRVVDKTVKFLEIDKMTQQPVHHNGEYFIDIKAAQALHPEREIVDENTGKVLGWDQNVPLVYYINDPYEPQYILDDKTQRHTINLYTPSQYIQEAQAVEDVPVDNIIYKTLLSGVGPTYLPYVLNYHAQVIFGKESLNMVLWMASLPTDPGGAGKSIATVELLSLIAGGSIQSINEKTAMSGWGDVVASSRLISLEDMTDLGKKEWDQIYAMIKQQTSNSYRKLNMKGGSISTKRVNVSLSGSSNHRPMLPPSDRRFLCLEPAHFRGETDQLSREDSKRIGEILRSRDYEPEVQTYVDYLLYIFTQPMEDYMHEALFERSPKTPYRAKWVGDGATNTQNIIHSLPAINDLLALMKFEDIESDHIVNILQMPLIAYNSDTGKSAVSHKWFAEILPFVVADRFKADVFSKHAISKMLQIDFKNVGILYSNKWKNPTPQQPLPVPDWKSWPTEGYVFDMSQEQADTYKEVIAEMLSNDEDSQPEDIE